MSHVAACMHKRESFGPTYAIALMMTNLTMNNRRNQFIDWPSLGRQEKEGPAKRTAGSNLPVMPEKLICPLPHTHAIIHTQIQYQYAGQSLTRAKLLKETAQKCYIQHTT